MIKLLSSAIVLLASSAALAYPAVGDYAKYVGTATMGTQAAAISFEQTIKSYNSSTDQYVVTVTQTIGNKVQSQDEAAASGDLMSPDMVKSVLASCEMYGGKTANLTVPAGTFATCAMPTQDDSGKVDGTVWIADVPFGIAKQVSTGSTSYTLELQSFTAGK